MFPQPVPIDSLVDCYNIDISELCLSKSLLLQVGLTPLHLAAQNGHKDLVGLLVSRYQASVDALTLVSINELLQSF